MPEALTADFEDTCNAREIAPAISTLLRILSAFGYSFLGSGRSTPQGAYRQPAGATGFLDDQSPAGM